MMSETKILVVEDEPKLVRLIKEVLTATGYKVISTHSGEQALELIAIEQPELVILDIVLSHKIDGYEVTKRVREYSDVPIIMLTAKVRESDLLRGFNLGADDYLIKPFSSKELLVRVRALLNRVRHVEHPGNDVIECGFLKIDLARKYVYVHQQRVDLTPTEYKVLVELANSRNRVLTHEMLLTAVWGQEYRDDIDYIRAYIRYLRRKLEPDPANPQLILTRAGIGYMLDCPSSN